MTMRKSIYEDDISQNSTSKIFKNNIYSYEIPGICPALKELSKEIDKHF